MCMCLDVHAAETPVLTKFLSAHLWEKKNKKYDKQEKPLVLLRMHRWSYEIVFHLACAV